MKQAAKRKLYSDVTALFYEPRLLSFQRILPPPLNTVPPPLNWYLPHCCIELVLEQLEQHVVRKGQRPRGGASCRCDGEYDLRGSGQCSLLKRVPEVVSTENRVLQCRHQWKPENMKPCIIIVQGVLLG